ncbi:sapecin-B-like [Cochliomyia hominivorax]
MKLGIFIVCFAFLLVAAVQSLEAQENHQQLNEHQQGLMDGFMAVNNNLPLNRQKRGTCSFHVAFCIAHCRVLGYGGGFCKRGICNCR